MKFYLISENQIPLEDYHINIPCNFNILQQPRSWIINLTNDEYADLSEKTSFLNYVEWKVIDYENPLFQFLLTKHIFDVLYINELDGEEYGINTFELSEYDLMYMKLMGWVQ